MIKLSFCLQTDWNDGKLLCNLITSLGVEIAGYPNPHSTAVENLKKGEWVFFILCCLLLIDNIVIVSLWLAYIYFALFCRFIAVLQNISRLFGAV